MKPYEKCQCKCCEEFRRKNVKRPQPKDIGLTHVIESSRCIYLNTAMMPIVNDLCGFGDMDAQDYMPNEWCLTINSRYDFDEVLKYIKEKYGAE